MQFLFILPVNAAVSNDPQVEWFTLETEHFYVHYHEGLQDLSYEVAEKSERINKTLTNQLDWQPINKTHLILTDMLDNANGWATVLPQNLMKIIVFTPDDISALSDYDDYLYQLISHEYTHIVHMDKVDGIPEWFRNLFGRFQIFGQIPLVFPNVFNPTWFKEGLAQYNESAGITTVGRGQNTYYRMLMRLEVQRGIKTLDAVSQPISSWPNGTTPYLYGVYFCNFISDVYGEDKLLAWIESYSGNVIPFRLDSTSEEIFGKGIHELWHEFDAYLKKDFATEITVVSKKGIVAGDNISSIGEQTGFIRQLDRDNVIYVKNNAVEPSSLIKMNVVNGDTSQIISFDYINAQVNSFDVHPVAGIVLSQVAPYRNASSFYDLFIVDPADGSSKRITNVGRYRKAIWNKRGDKILALHHQQGRAELHLLDKNGELVSVVWQGEADEDISSYDWSDDENSVVASVWRQGLGWNLELLNIKKQQWRVLTQNQNIEGHVNFVQGKNSIVYAADYDGVFNIYSMDLNQQQPVKLTNVIGGAFNPVVSIDGKTLYYQGMTNKGTDLFVLDQDRWVGKQVKLQRSNQIAGVAKKSETTGAVNILSNKPYSGIRHLASGWWLPNADVSEKQQEYGVSLSGSDPLEMHSYSLYGAYDFKNNWFLGQLGYFNDVGSFGVGMFVSRKYSSYAQYDRRFLRKTLVAIEAFLPVINLESSWEMRLGISGEYYKDVGADSLGMSFEDQVVGAAYTYNSDNRYLKGIGDTDGVKFRLLLENSDLLNSDYSGTVAVMSFRDYYRIFDDNVLATRVVVGVGGKSTRQFSLGGIDMTSVNTFTHASIFNERDYALRGYEENLSALSGNRMYAASLEWRFPLYVIDRGLLPIPFGIGRTYGSMFIDVGKAWDKGGSSNNRYSTNKAMVGVGIEIKADLVFGYSAVVPVKIGFSRGLDDNVGNNEIYLTLGADF